jgi:hypothetical protein
MSVVTALSLLLFVGFVATALVGFLGWRQRMREGAAFIPVKRRRTQDQHANGQAKDTQCAFEGARL